MDPEELLCRPEDGLMCEPGAAVPVEGGLCLEPVPSSSSTTRTTEALDDATADLLGQGRPARRTAQRTGRRRARQAAERPARRAPPPSSLTPEQLAEAREATQVPEGGFRVTGAGGRRQRIDVDTGDVDQVAELMQDPAVRQHIEETLAMFENDPEHPIRREDIDLPFVLATAMREGGARSALSTDDDRIVSAGRDLHTAGRSGMDHLWNRRAEFPAEIRDEIQRVRGNPAVPGHFTDRRGHDTAEPAFLPERDMLAAHIVEAAAREQAFRRRFERAFSSFEEEERAALLGGMSQDARRAWTQATFGSMSPQLLRETRERIEAARREGRSIEEIAADPAAGLDAIITDDTMLPDALSRQRCRVTAAEARLLEQVMPEELRSPERTEILPPRPRAARGSRSR